MIAQVIVDISSSEVDRVFDYELGDLQATAGYRVTVPFGRMTVEGYIIGLSDTTDCPPDKLKRVQAVLDDRPVVTEEMLALMRDMTHRYHLRIVDVLRLFIPAEMRGGRVKELVRLYARLAPTYREADIASFVRPSAHAQAELVQYLKQTESESVAFLNRSFSAAALRNLTQRGVIEQFAVEEKRTPYGGVAGDDKTVVLNAEQQAAVDEMSRTRGQTYLLHGVTGSGKTEVYMHCISRELAAGRSAVMLVPEISLTPQVLRNFRARFGGAVAILHSGLSVGERFDEWRRLLTGEARVAVGARSAIFAPLTELGVIIIDEEHDSSYVSESNPRYITAEVAAFRARYNGCNLILGSATPSIESYHAACHGDIRLLELKNRVTGRPMPRIEVVDMRKEVYAGNNGIFSRELEAALTECVGRGDQAIIFINRRGYSSYMLCRSCGYVAKCEQCDVSLVYHKAESVLKCHYCGNRYAALDICPVCKSPHIRQGYVGTQQVVERLREMFPDTEILRMDNDTTQNKDAHLKILSEFSAKKAGILVGTQMIAKGHDFPDVTLVGIVDADMSLHFADYRASERTYQLITQVAGRAGRDRKPGSVVLQTYSPGHYVYRYAVANDYIGFYEKECNLREVTKYPPFSKIVRVLLSCADEGRAAEQLKGMFQEIKAVSDTWPDAFAYLGAMKAPVKRIQNKFRLQILMRLVDDFDNLMQTVYNITDRYALPGVSCFVEINPNNLS